jgi:hypothetical protein
MNDRSIAYFSMEMAPDCSQNAHRRARAKLIKPVREIRLTLDGDMERYVWLLNNQPLSESDSIEIKDTNL